jgi:hypothetical protein
MRVFHSTRRAHEHDRGKVEEMTVQKWKKLLNLECLAFFMYFCVFQHIHQ